MNIKKPFIIEQCEREHENYILNTFFFKKYQKNKKKNIIKRVSREFFTELKV